MQPSPIITQPQIGQYWPGQGGIYAGLCRGYSGRPDYHLILALAGPGKLLSWDDAMAWASTVEADGHTDFAMPTRFESALLYATLRDQCDTDTWHWMGSPLSAESAWIQHFYDGTQSKDGKRYRMRARAVRRFPIGPSEAALSQPPQ